MSILILILCILNIVFMIALPNSAMFIQWSLDKKIKQYYSTKPWQQDQLITNSRAYHQHLVNHCLLSMVTIVWILLSIIIGFKILFYIGCGLFTLSLLYPFIKEFYIDPKVFHKPLNDIDWRERFCGAIIPLPIFIYSLILFL